MRVTHCEIEAIDAEIEKFRKLGILDDRLLHRLELSKAKTIQEHNEMVRELKAIKADNYEVYQLIYWHDLQNKTWEQCYKKVFPELWSVDPASAALKIVRRYLSKRYDNLDTDQIQEAQT